MKNCVVPIGSTLKIGQHNVRQGYMLYSDKRLGLDSKAIFRTETTNCRLKVCVKAYCTTECRNCQSTLHHSRLKVCGKHTTQQKAESLWQRTLHNRRLKCCQSTVHNGRLKTVSKHSTVVGHEVGPKNSTDQGQHWNSSAVLLSKNGNPSLLEKDKGRAGRGVRGRWLFRLPGQERRGRVRNKQGRRQGSNLGNSTRALYMLLRQPGRDCVEGEGLNKVREHR